MFLSGGMRGRALAAVALAMTLSACSGTAPSSSSLPSIASHSASGVARHKRMIGAESQPSDSSPCGTCSCGVDENGNPVPTSDQGDPCQGGGDSGSPNSGGPAGGGSGSAGSPARGGSGGGGGAGTGVDCTTDPTQPQCPQQVACVGTPQQCAGVACNGSPETIGDIINDPVKNADVVITEMNALWMDNGNNSSYTWGWMYADAGGNRYIQVNYANKAQWSLSLSIAIGKLGLGVGVATPGGYSAIAKWNGQLPPGAFPKKCETKGATLV
jgi:hypothetical protein